MTIGELDATVILAGGDISAYLIDIKRQANLCNPGQSFEITLKQTFPVASYNPWDTITIEEAGEVVLTGYIHGFHMERPSQNIIMTGMDTYKRAREWFIDDVNLIMEGQTVAFWLDYFCNLCGLAYTIVPPSGGSEIAGYNLPIGQRMVSDALMQTIAFVGWQMRVNRFGVLEFLDLDAIMDFARDQLLSFGTPITDSLVEWFGGSPDVVPSDETASRWFDFTNDMEEGERVTSDETTRTVAKIWGYDPIAGASLLYQARRDVVGTVPEDRIGLLAHPGIGTLAQAETLAESVLDQFGYLEQKADLEVLGNPLIRVGDIGKTTAFVAMGDTEYNETITAYETRLDQDGYSMRLMLGGRCPELPDFPLLMNEPVLDCLCTDGLLTFLWSNAVNRVVYPSNQILEWATHVAVVGNKLYMAGWFREVVLYTDYWFVGFQNHPETPDLDDNLIWVQFFEFDGEPISSTQFGPIRWAVDCLNATTGAYQWTSAIEPRCDINQHPANRKPFGACSYLASVNGGAIGVKNEDQFHLHGMVADATYVYLFGEEEIGWTESHGADARAVGKYNTLIEARSTGGGTAWATQIEAHVKAITTTIPYERMMYMIQDATALYIVGAYKRTGVADDLLYYRIAKSGGGIMIRVADIVPSGWTNIIPRAATVYGNHLIIGGSVNVTVQGSWFLESREKASGTLEWRLTAIDPRLIIGVCADSYGVYVLHSGALNTYYLRMYNHSGGLVWTQTINGATDGFGNPLVVSDSAAGVVGKQGAAIMTHFGDCLFYITVAGPTLIRRSKIDGSFISANNLDGEPIRAMQTFSCNLYSAGGQSGVGEDGKFEARGRSL